MVAARNTGTPSAVLALGLRLQIIVMELVESPAGQLQRGGSLNGSELLRTKLLQDMADQRGGLSLRQLRTMPFFIRGF